jgi:hypothetical protein
MGSKQHTNALDSSNGCIDGLHALMRFDYDGEIKTNIGALGGTGVGLEGYSRQANPHEGLIKISVDAISISTDHLKMAFGGEELIQFVLVQGSHEIVLGSSH